MIRIASTLALLSLGATFALAQATGGAALEERKKLMSDTNKQMKAVSNMVKGSEPFDAAKVQSAFKTTETNTAKAKSLFPADSKDVGETRATPAIWSNAADFAAKFDQFGAVIKAAQTGTKDLESLKGEFKKIDDSCNACHKDYRAARK